MLDFAALQTPPDDGDLLIAPDPPEWQTLIEQNRRLARSWDGCVLDASLGELRQLVRRGLAGDPRPALVMTGHQPDFVHPGVWAKHLAARRLADLTEASTVNLVVDQDSPAEIALHIPVRKGDLLDLARVVCLGELHGRPFERLPAVTGDALRSIAAAVREAMGDAYDDSCMPVHLEALVAADPSAGLVEQLRRGLRAIDDLFGTAQPDRCVSEVWPAWHAADMLLNASRFAQAYNEALVAYRRELRIKSSARPVPDLRRENERIELPLWSLGPDDTRRRVWVRPDSDHIEIFAERESIGRLPVSQLRSIESASRAVRDGVAEALRPRAITLTLWARLFACDLFVHGIGGAKYDRITDGIIKRYYGITPPAYACVSATLHLPLPRTAVTRDDLLRVARRARDVVQNPQRHVGPHADRRKLQGEIDAAIEQARDLRARHPGDHGARRDAFQRIRRAKSELLALQPDLVEAQQARCREIEDQLTSNRIAAGREYFVGLYPRKKLAGLADAICAAWH
jgi:hypothetical protein